MDDDGMSENGCLSREELWSAFEELEIMWKFDATIESFGKILSIFGVSCVEDLIPANIQATFVENWNKYLSIRKQYDCLDDDDEDEEEVDSNERGVRFNALQERMFYAKETILMFMRTANFNKAFPIPTSPEILFWYTPLDMTDLSPLHMLLIYLLGNFYRLRYRRSEGRVCRQIFKDNLPTHAWMDIGDIKGQISSLTSKEMSFQMWKNANTGNNSESAVKYLSGCTDLEFPDLKIKRRVWSFNDGIYDATDDKFMFYTDPIDDNLVSCKIIEKDFVPVYFSGAPRVSPKLTYDEIHTPKFDSIFEPQQWDGNMIKWMFAFMGRLFYEVGEKDSWQVIPFLKGVAGTGKSTVIKVVQMMYNTRDVGVISNNIEKKFGLSTVFHKTIFIIPELKGDFAMDQADFQSMVTGEELSMAVKHGHPLTGQWTAPGIIAGNESAGWQDKSGSISRRIVVFDFPNKVPEEKLNPRLIDEIKTSEIPSILRKCSLAYQWAVDSYGSSDIWTALPGRICEEKKRLQYSTNPLYAFLNSDQVVIEEDSYTPESIFISKLKQFATLKFPNCSISWNADFYQYLFNDFSMYIQSDTRPWPMGSSNEQKQTYVFGCQVAIE